MFNATAIKTSCTEAEMKSFDGISLQFLKQSNDKVIEVKKLKSCTSNYKLRYSIPILNTNYLNLCVYL